MSAFSSLMSRQVLFYLKIAAKLQLAKHTPRIIGITGSAGKTSTRNAIHAVLKSSHSVKVSYKANSETGIPLNLLDLSPRDYSVKDWLKLMALVPVKLLTTWPRYHTYIVEMGIDSPLPPKNMSYLLSLIKPDIGVFLNAAPVHAHSFDQLVKDADNKDREDIITHLIAAEKGKLIQHLPASGLAVLNADDPCVIPFRTKTRAPVAIFGKEASNTVWFESMTQSLDGTSIRFHAGSELATLHLKAYLLPDHFACTFAAALCVALHTGQTLAQGVQNLEKHFRLPPGRSSLLAGIKGSVLLDSSYNASTQPTIDALKLINTLKPKQGIAILGDMREMGRSSEAEHLKVAQACLRTTKAVFLVGPQMKKFVLPFLHKHNHVVTWHESALDAAKAVEKILRVGDMVLVKGSQNTIFLETAVKHLMRHKHKAKKLLCRQTSYWESVRSGLS